MNARCLSTLVLGIGIGMLIGIAVAPVNPRVSSTDPRITGLEALIASQDALIGSQDRLIAAQRGRLEMMDRCGLFLQFTLDDHRTVISELDMMDENTANIRIQLEEGGITLERGGYLLWVSDQSFLPRVRWFAETGRDHALQAQECYGGTMPELPGLPAPKLPDEQA
jgi:hypothetical protein